MDYGHHDPLHCHRVYSLQAVGRPSHPHVTTIGNQVLMTVIHTGVILSEAKDLSREAHRSFASLRMTWPVVVVKLHYRAGGSSYSHAGASFTMYPAARRRRSSSSHCARSRVSMAIVSSRCKMGKWLEIR